MTDDAVKGRLVLIDGPNGGPSGGSSSVACCTRSLPRLRAEAGNGASP